MAGGEPTATEGGGLDAAEQAALREAFAALGKPSSHPWELPLLLALASAVVLIVFLPRRRNAAASKQR